MERYFFALILSFFSVQCFAADEDVEADKPGSIAGEVVEFGYYGKADGMQRERNLSTPTGYTRTVGTVVLLKSTERIPLEQGRLFGFKFRIDGFPKDQVAVDLRLVVTHPQITRPNGSIVSAYQYPVTLDVVGGAVENQSGYSLDHDYELVEGQWRFQYWLRDKMLVEQTFETVKAKPVAAQAPLNTVSKPTATKSATKKAKATKSITEKTKAAKTAKAKTAKESGTGSDTIKAQVKSEVNSHNTKRSSQGAVQSKDGKTPLQPKQLTSAKPAATQQTDSAATAKKTVARDKAVDDSTQP